MKSILFTAFPRSVSSLIADRTWQGLCHQMRPLLASPYHSRELLIPYVLGSAWQGSMERRTSKMRPYHNILKNHGSGSIIKDVHQPYVVKDFLDKNPGAFNTVFIQRDLPDVIYAVAAQGWWWPMLTHDRNRELWIESEKQRKQYGYLTDFHFAHSLPALVRSMIHTYRTVYRPTADYVLRYDEFTRDSNALWNLTAQMGYSPKPFNYINDDFKRDTERVEARRTTELWNVINGMVIQVRESLK